MNQQIRNMCKFCSGSGVISESFQPPRPCSHCNGAGSEGIGKSTQIIHFVGGYKRTIRNIKSVWENECVHILTHSGIEWIINKSNVLCIEKIDESPTS